MIYAYQNFKAAIKRKKRARDAEQKRIRKHRMQERVLKEGAKLMVFLALFLPWNFVWGGGQKHRVYAILK